MPAWFSEFFHADLQSVKFTLTVLFSNHLRNQKYCVPLQPANKVAGWLKQGQNYLIIYFE